MARPKKDGKRATGIQGKSGYLYIVRSKTVMENGVKKSKKEWIRTGLKDTPENVKVASEQRKTYINNSDASFVDRNVLLSDYVDSILEKKKREVTDSTYSSYYYRGKHIKEYFSDIKVRDIKKNLVEDFLDNLFIVDKLQQRSAKDVKVFFGNVMDQAIKDGIIVANPVKEVTLNKNLAVENAKEKVEDEEFFSYDEALLYLNKVETHKLYELFYLTLFFGLRREEVLGLKWSSIDFKDKTMTINHTVTKGMKRVNRNNSTKSDASKRQYPLNNEQIDMFNQLKNKEEKNRKLFGSEYVENDYIFKHADGSLYYPDYPSKVFKKVIKANPDLPQGITFHGLRSSCVSILVHEGHDVKSIQKWVGHADIDTTLRIYAKVKDKASKQEISDSMSGKIQPKKYNESQIEN